MPCIEYAPFYESRWLKSAMLSIFGALAWEPAFHCRIIAYRPITIEKLVCRKDVCSRHCET